MAVSTDPLAKSLLLFLLSLWWTILTVNSYVPPITYQHSKCPTLVLLNRCYYVGNNFPWNFHSNSKSIASTRKRRRSIVFPQRPKTTLFAVIPSITTTSSSNDDDDGENAIGNNRTEVITKIKTAFPVHTQPQTSNVSTRETSSHANSTEMINLTSIPTYRQLIVFCSVTILIWLSEPLLSLVDITVVGLTQGTASTIQLASLGPATTLTDSLLYMTYFLSIATTNRIATERAATSHNKYRQLQQTTSHVLGVSVLLGLMVTLVALIGAPTILKYMAGSSGSPELLFYATRYTWIRAMAATAAVAGVVLQSFCLACLNTRTPAIAVAAAAVTNVCGDVALAKYGVQGAAIATALSSVVASSILLQAVRQQLRDWRKLELEGNNDFEITTSTNESLDSVSSRPRKTTSTSCTTSSSSSTPEYILSTNRPQIPLRTLPDKVPLLSLPDKEATLQLFSLAGPIFFVIMAKIACYGAMTIRCTNFGVEALAAHSIMMRIFFFWGCFGDSLSQTAQSFLPATLYPQPNRLAYGKILQRLFVLATAIGLVDSQVARLILQNFGQYLTKDITIINLMKDHVLFLSLSILLHPFIMLLEGTVIASRNFRSLVITYTATLGLHFGILQFFCDSFPSVWRTFFFFQSIRLGLYSWRVWRTNQIYKNTIHPTTSNPLPAVPSVS